MDFHSLTRRELQSLCKLNKIPANITNLAMADALQSLHTVEGIEEFLNPLHSETASDVVESAETIDLLSPKAPQTRCRTSTRQRVKKTEAENLPPTATRTTRRTVKQLAGGVKDVPKTPAVSTTLRKTPLSSSSRNVNNQLNECHEQSLVDQKIEAVRSSPATIVTNSQMEGAIASSIALKQETNVHEMKTYSRRSTGLTEKKSEESRVKKDSEKAVKIKSFLEEVNVASEQNVPTVESGAQVEDICNAFEKLDVLPVVEKIETVVDEESAHKSEEEIKDGGELDGLKEESEETSNPCEENASTEAENDQVSDVSTLCEEEQLEQKLDLEDEKFDSSEVNDHNLVMSEGNGSSTTVSDMIIDNIENPIESLNSDNEISFSETDGMEQDSVNTVNGTFDVIPTVVNNDSTVIEEVQDLKRDLFIENQVNKKDDADFDEKDHFSVFSVPCLPNENHDVIDKPTSVTPMKKATPFKNISIISNDKENIDSGRKLPFLFVDDGKKGKKENDESETLKSYTEISIRQLRKQVKALTLKSIKPYENEEAITKRPALQAICENKMVGGETRN